MIEIIINDRIYKNNLSLQFGASLSELCRDFSFEMPQALSQEINIQDTVNIKINGIDIISGYIEAQSINIKTTQSINQFSGRSFTADLVDCSPEIPGRFFKDQSFKQIAQSLCSLFNITLDFQVIDVQIPYTQVNETETVVNFLTRLAAKYGYILTTNANSHLLITDGEQMARRPAIHTLHYQNNDIISAGSIFDYSQRFSSYIVKGQNDTQTTLNHFDDLAITRYRPKIITEAGISDERNKLPVNYAVRAAGNSISVKFKIVNAELYMPGETVYVYYPALRIDQVMIIETVDIESSPDVALTTNLTLADPRSYLASKPKVNKSNDEIKALPYA